MWSDRVFAYWEEPVTSADTEQVTGIAKRMNRMGRGYSFEVLRARLLYQPQARAASTQEMRVEVAERHRGCRASFLMQRMTRSASRRV
jgi:hypothetical protein